MRGESPVEPGVIGGVSKGVYIYVADPGGEVGYP